MELNLSGISEDALLAGVKLLGAAVEKLAEDRTEEEDALEEAQRQWLSAQPALDGPPLGAEVIQQVIEQDLLSEEEDQKLAEYLESDQYMIDEARRRGAMFMRELPGGSRKVAYPSGEVEILPPTKMNQIFKEVSLTWTGSMPTLKEISEVQKKYPELSAVPHPDMTWTPPEDVKDGAKKPGTGSDRAAILEKFVSETSEIWLKENMLAILLVLHLDGPQIPDVLWISRNPLLPEFPTWWHGEPDKGRQRAVEALVAAGYVKYDDEGFLVLANE